MPKSKGDGLDGAQAPGPLERMGRELIRRAKAGEDKTWIVDAENEPRLVWLRWRDSQSLPEEWYTREELDEDLAKGMIVETAGWLAAVTDSVLVVVPSRDLADDGKLRNFAGGVKILIETVVELVDLVPASGEEA